MKIHQKYQSENKPVLEINPTHPLIIKLAHINEENGNSQKIEDAAYMLLDQARIIQGEPLDDLTNFARRMSELMQKTL